MFKTIHDIPDAIYTFVDHKALYGSTEAEIEQHIFRILPKLYQLPYNREAIHKSLELLLGYSREEIRVMTSKYNNTISQEK